MIDVKRIKLKLGYYKLFFINPSYSHQATNIAYHTDQYDVSVPIIEDEFFSF